MNTALIISGFAMLSAGVSILALVRAYEEVVLAHVTIDPEGGDAAPSGTAREASAPRRADIADNYLRNPPWADARLAAVVNGTPRMGRELTFAACGCAIRGGKFKLLFDPVEIRKTECLRCGTVWVPASRCDFELGQGETLEMNWIR